MFRLSCVIAQLLLFAADFSQLENRVSLFLSSGRPPCTQQSLQLENRLFAQHTPPTQWQCSPLGLQAHTVRLPGHGCCAVAGGANQAKVTFLSIIYSADRQNHNCVHVFILTDILHECGSQVFLVPPAKESKMHAILHKKHTKHLHCR